MADSIDKATAFAFLELQKAGDRRTALPIELQTLILVCSAQGMIDNGGLQYFFESNWEDLTPYRDFCEAYRRIGALDAAEKLERAAALFRFPNSHLHADKRIAAMERLWADEKSGFADLDSGLCGDEKVWQQLEQYVKQHRKAFAKSGKRPVKPPKR